MRRSRYKSSIPPNANEVVKERFSDGSKKVSHYFVKRVWVGWRYWYEDGSVDVEWGIKDGQRHGLRLEYHQNGRLAHVERYRNGRENGTARQWSEDGKLLVTYRLANGVGLDLWCDFDTGTLAEEHLWPDCGQVGYNRLWNKNERTIWQEQYYTGAGHHGIWREWNKQGRLKRGFPHFYVHDKRVTKRQYANACEGDPTLARYRPEDDRPYRKLPAEYVAQRRKRAR